MITADQFDLAKLIKEMLAIDHHTMANRWRADCEIIRDYMPPFPRKDTRPTCQVRYIPSDSFLRWSAGVVQGYFWDLYGDDCLSPELALLALLRAPPPPCVFRGM